MSQLQVTGEAKIRDIQGPVVANSGVITALDGAASQYVRGDGTLADFPTSTGGGSSVSYYLNSSVSQGTIGGVAYRQLGKTPIAGAGTDIAISANGYVASYLTDANDPALLEVPAGNFNCEFYFSVNNNTGDPFTYAEVYKYDGTTFTLLGTSVGVPEYITEGTVIKPYYFAIPVAQSVLTVTDRIAIRIYVNVDGRTVTLHTENNHLCQVVTTFSKGLISLNNLTRQNQFFATGTSGTDFGISSSVATHTFNLPVASATNTGKLSSTDWSTFNNKLSTATAASTYVPYTGANANVDLGTRDLSSRFIYLNGTGTIGGNLFLRKDVDPGFTLNYTTLYSTDNNFGIGSTDGTNTKKAIFSFGSLTDNTLRTYTLPDASGTLALTSDLSAYLPLAGGTLTGILNISTASYLTSRLKLINTATGGNSWSLSSGNQNNSTNNSLFTIINETLSKNTFVLSPTGKLALGADLGTTNPSDDLAIFSTNTILKVVDLTGNNSNLNLQATNTAAYIRAGYTTTAIPLILQTGNIDILTIAANGQVTLSTNVTTTGAQFVQNGFYLTNANAGSLAGYTHMWARNEGINFGLRNGTGGASFIFQSANSYNYTFPAASGTLALSSDLGAYLPLTGGTLTGALSGTSATFSGNLLVGPTTSGFDSVSQIASSSTGNIISALTLQNTSLTETAGTGVNLNFGGRLNWLGRISTQFVGTTGGGDASMSFLTPSGGNLATRLHITSGGNVGIGTSSPDYPLVVQANSGAAQAVKLLGRSSDNISILSFHNNANSTQYGYIAGIPTEFRINSGSSIPITFTNADTERMRITSGGLVAIGTTSALVNESSLAVTSNGNTATFKTTLNGGNCLLLWNSGGSGNIVFATGSSFTAAGSITSSGTVTSYNVTSDYRLKKDYKDYNALELLTKIKTYDFAWNLDNKRMYGVIAHELQEVLPYAVQGEKDAKDMQQVDYSKLVPIMVKAIQELAARIKQLENK